MDLMGVWVYKWVNWSWIMGGISVDSWGTYLYFLSACVWNKEMFFLFVVSSDWL